MVHNIVLSNSCRSSSTTAHQLPIDDYLNCLSIIITSGLNQKREDIECGVLRYQLASR